MKIRFNKLIRITRKLAPSIIFICLMLSLTYTAQSQSVNNQASVTVDGDLSNFIVDPGADEILKFKSSSDVNIKFSIKDYLGQPVSTGTLHFKGGVASISVNLPEGYYEINLSDVNITFGILSILPFKGDRDAFFCMDAALSRIEPSMENRAFLIKMMQRIGIATARERFTSAVQKDMDTRKLYHDAGISVLELMEGGAYANALTQNASFPQNMIAATTTWVNNASKYINSAGGVEIYNEPDLKRTPGDQYSALVKAASYVFDKQNINVPIVGGTFSTDPAGFHDIASANDLLNNVDCISFHNYEKAIFLEQTIQSYHDWLNKSNKASLPLWITECGMAWKNGAPRPVLSQDLNSANEITMKAIEAKANGIAKYFAFVIDYYQEKEKNFGMVGKDRTPLRSLAAYANCIKLLSRYNYVGNISNMDSKLKRGRVFAPEKLGLPYIAVLYTGDANPSSVVKLAAKATKLVGIDGRSLKASNLGIPVPDGLTYVYLSSEDANRLIGKDLKVSNLSVSGRAFVKKGETPSPIVLQYIYQNSNVVSISNKYYVKQENANSFPITIRVQNLSNSPITESLALGQLTQAAGNTPKTVTVNGNQYVDVNWTVDMSQLLGVSRLKYLKVTGSSGGGTQTLDLPFLIEGTLKDNMSAVNDINKLPFTDLTKWHKFNNNTGTADFQVSGGNFGMNVSFPSTGDNWAYPKFDLPQTSDNSSTGVLMRVKISQSSQNVALFVLTKDNKSYWSTDVFPADGLWHVVYVDFSELKPFNSNLSSYDKTYDIKPANIKQISIGMKSNVPTNSLEISNLSLIKRDQK